MKDKIQELKDKAEDFDIHVKFKDEEEEFLVFINRTKDESTCGSLECRVSSEKDLRELAYELFKVEKDIMINCLNLNTSTYYSIIQELNGVDLVKVKECVYSVKSKYVVGIAKSNSNITLDVFTNKNDKKEYTNNLIYLYELLEIKSLTTEIKNIVIKEDDINVDLDIYKSLVRKCINNIAVEIRYGKRDYIRSWELLEVAIKEANSVIRNI